MKRYFIIGGLVLLLVALISQAAYAQGPVTPPPPPQVTPITPVDPMAAAKQIDEANARADQWQTVATQAMSKAQGAIDSAYASLWSAQASIGQMQIALQQSEAARVAAQQGQIQQAVQAAGAAQMAGLQAVQLASASGQSATSAVQQAGDAMRAVAELRSSLITKEAQNAALTRNVVQLTSTVAQADKDKTALASALVMERQRSDLLAKVAIGLFLLLGLLMSYIALVLVKVTRIFKQKSTNDRLVILDERGRVKAQIETLS
jgi:hypothetical protein